MIYIGECKNAILINRGMILDAIFYRGTHHGRFYYAIMVLRIKVYYVFGSAKYWTQRNVYRETILQMQLFGEWFNWACNTITNFWEMVFQKFEFAKQA